MHGGSRAKRTRLDATTPAYRSLQRDCDGGHEHEPYKIYLDGVWKFDTSIEGAYPDLLCKRLSEQLAQTWPASIQPRDSWSLRMQTTSYTSKQHKRFPQLIPEFLKVFDMDLTQQALPPLCKQLGPSTTGGASMGISKVGQFHSVKQFLDKAMNLHHPIDTLNPVPDSTQKAIFNILTKGPSEIAMERIGAIKHILELDTKLQDREKAFHKTLPPYMRQVLKGKKTLLFKELLRETSYDDMEVCDFVQGGIQLFGHHSVPPYASTKIVAAVSTADQLQRESVWRRRALHTDTDADAAKLLDAQSMDEVDRGFLSGPFSTEAEVSDFLGRDDWVVNPRFVLLQGPSQKPRVIDNCRQSGLNATFTSLEHLQLHDFDMVVSVAKLIKSCNSPDGVKMTLSTGEVLKGRPHASLKNPQWKARSLDLAKAYKQLAVHPNSRHLAERDVSKLPPLLTAHFRQHLQGKMTAAMAREVRTLCYACDLLLLGRRPASALDTLVQRVKALELQATGSHFSIAQRLELLPREEEVLAGRLEAKEAAREAREDYTQRIPFDPKVKGDPKGGKGKDTKGKGDGKDDNLRLRDKGGKGDAKKEKGS